MKPDKMNLKQSLDYCLVRISMNGVVMNQVLINSKVLEIVFN